MVEWRPSAAADLQPSGSLDSDGPQTAAAACAAEPGSVAESECTLGRGKKKSLIDLLSYQCCT